MHTKCHNLRTWLYLITYSANLYLSKSSILKVCSGKLALKCATSAFSTEGKILVLTIPHQNENSIKSWKSKAPHQQVSFAFQFLAGLRVVDFCFSISTAYPNNVIKIKKHCIPKQAFLLLQFSE